MSHSTKKVTVSCWTVDGKFIAQYQSISFAAKSMRIRASNIHQALKNDYLCNGYKWKREAV